MYSSVNDRSPYYRGALKSRAAVDAGQAGRPGWTGGQAGVNAGMRRLMTAWP
jgi:hypothetical protein